MSEINDTEEPILIPKYDDGMYHKGYFFGVINIDINLVKCEDKIFILSITQSYVFHWYHTYLLHPGMYQTEAMIHQKFY